MNIVILPSWFRMKSNIISGSFFMEQAVSMTKLGHKVTIIDAQIIPTRTYLKRERDFGIKHYIENNVEIYEFKTGSFFTGKIPSLYVKIYKMKVELILKKILKRQKVDIIHSHSFLPAGIAGQRLSKKYNIPCVLTEHFTALVTDKLNSRQVEYVKPTFDSTDGVSCVSEFFADTMYKKYRLEKRPSFIPNILNPLFRYYAGEKSSHPFVFTTISRLVEQKKVDVTIKAFAMLKNAGYDAKLNILGDGEKRQELEALVKSLELSDSVEFFGNVSREKVYQTLKETNAFTMGSVTETFGVVYIEALASGCPVIAVKNGAAEEIVNETNGYLVDPDNIEQYFGRMRDMIENYDNFDKKSISDFVVNKYSEENVASLYQNLYLKAIEKHK